MVSISFATGDLSSALVRRGTMNDTTEDVVCLEHVTKTYPGVERSLRGTKLEWKGPALWLRNLVGLARLTSNTAPPVQALRSEERRVGKECRSRGARYH